jgi:hypothetical protein
VSTSTVPVTGKRLGVERNLHAELNASDTSEPTTMLKQHDIKTTHVFGDADEQEPGQPEVVAHVDALARADLELPLRRHNLGVDARDVDAGVQASTVVRLNDVAGENFPSADTAVVGALGTRETTLRPAVRSAVLYQKSSAAESGDQARTLPRNVPRRRGCIPARYRTKGGGP